MAALKRHLLESVPISDLCDALGIAPNLFYRWQREFYKDAEGGIFAKYLDDFEQAVTESGF